MKKFQYSSYVNEHRKKGFPFPEVDLLNPYYMDTVNLLIGQCTAIVREKKGVSRKDLIKGTKFTETELEHFESGYEPATAELLQRIESRLELDLYPVLYTSVILAHMLWPVVSAPEAKAGGTKK